MVEKNQYPDLELIVTSGFNRWDSLWGGNEVINRRRQSEAEELISFMADLGLQYILPRGTITYSARGSASTIDLIFASEHLVNDLESRTIYLEDHGSYHKLLHSRFLIHSESRSTTPRYLFKDAPWTKICEYIQDQVYKISAIPEMLDLYSHQIVNVLTEAIQKFVPIAKRSVYTKRWWTKDLSRLRMEYTQLRNLFRRKRRNQEQGLCQIEAQAWEAKHVYFKAMRNQKKKHWDDLLEESENIWQAAKYLATSTIAKPSFSPIARLKNSDGSFVHQTANISATLLQTFFPPLPAYKTLMQTMPENLLPMIAILVSLTDG